MQLFLCRGEYCSFVIHCHLVIFSVFLKGSTHRIKKKNQNPNNRKTPTKSLPSIHSYREKLETVRLMGSKTRTTNKMKSCDIRCFYVFITSKFFTWTIFFH